MDNFHRLVKSPGFTNFVTAIKPFIDGPPELRLFETNIGAQDLVKNPILEVLEVRPKVHGEGIESLLGQIASQLEKMPNPLVLRGASLNLDETQIVILRGFADEGVSRIPTREKPEN